MLRSLVDKFRSSSEVPQTDVHFMSESGLIDIFLMLGPTPSDLFRQNAALTGVYPLPPVRSFLRSFRILSSIIIILIFDRFHFQYGIKWN